MIKEIITEYTVDPVSVGEVEFELVFDEANDHYELLHNGWIREHRIHGPVIHVDIRDGKIWIQHDGTPEGIAEQLVERGVPKDRIVLAFHSPRMRKYTDFAVA
jgi:ketopantoate reductase